MGYSTDEEALEGRTGPPTWAELLRFGRAAYRDKALQVIAVYQLEHDVFRRRKAAEAVRAHRLRRNAPRHRRLLLDTDANLTGLVRIVRPPLPVLTAVQDLVRHLLRNLPPPHGRPGRPPLPYAIKAAEEISTGDGSSAIIEESEARDVLRGCGIPLSTGRMPTPESCSTRRR